MKAAIIIGVLLLTFLAAVSIATHNANHGGEPTPSPTSSPVVGEYFTSQGGRVWPTVNRTDYDWHYVEIRSTTTGVHFNLNRQARSYDSSADDWSRVFTEYSSFTTDDYVSFCAPATTITVQARDRTTFSGTGSATLTEVPPCITD